MGICANALTDYKRYAQLSPSDYYATAAIERVTAALGSAKAASAKSTWDICVAETGMRKVQACDKFINENSSSNKFGFYYRGVGWEESGNLRKRSDGLQKICPTQSIGLLCYSGD